MTLAVGVASTVGQCGFVDETDRQMRCRARGDMWMRGRMRGWRGRSGEEEEEGESDDE